MTFEDLGLHDLLLDGLDSMGFHKPTPVQEQAIPIILAGKDIIASAQTGTGKTAAFVLPLIHRILENPAPGKIRALVIVPTRELAVQIDQQIQGLSYFTSVSSIPIYGGSDASVFSQEKTALTSGVEVVIATPGRFISHLNLGYVNLKELDILVLDEADRMLDMGFHRDLMKIVSHVNTNRQTLMFSATMPNHIVQLAREILREPERVSIALSKPAEGIEQAAYVVFDEDKARLADSLLAAGEYKSVIVFASTKQAVRKVYETLKRRNFLTGIISSDLEQAQREEVLLAFRNRKIAILVATDVVSRGIDIDGIELVVNYDVPNDAEDYVHRVGRTARAERKGKAITFIGPDDMRKFGKIEKLVGYEIPKLPIPEGIPAGPEYNPARGSSGPGKRNFQRGKRKSGPNKAKPGRV